MIENFAGECSFVKRAASMRGKPPQVRARRFVWPRVRCRGAHPSPPSTHVRTSTVAPAQTLLFSASFECLEPSHPHATRAKNFTDLVRASARCASDAACFVTRFAARRESRGRWLTRRTAVLRPRRADHRPQAARARHHPRALRGGLATGERHAVQRGPAATAWRRAAAARRRRVRRVRREAAVPARDVRHDDRREDDDLRGGACVRRLCDHARFDW